MQYNLALTYYQLDQFQQARGPLANSLERWPDLFQLNALYGAVLVKLGDDFRLTLTLHQRNGPGSEGPRDYQPALRSDPRTRAKEQGRSAVLGQLRYLEEASSLRPQEAEPHRRLAQIYTLTSRPHRLRPNSKKPID